MSTAKIERKKQKNSTTANHTMKMKIYHTTSDMRSDEDDKETARYIGKQRSKTR